MKQVEAFRISGNSWSILGAQNKDKGTALQTLCLKPGLNFVCDTGYKHSLHKDSKDGFKDMGFLRVRIIFSHCITLSWSFLKAVCLSKKLFYYYYIAYTRCKSCSVNNTYKTNMRNTSGPFTFHYQTVTFIHRFILSNILLSLFTSSLVVGYVLGGFCAKKSKLL